MSQHMRSRRNGICKTLQQSKRSISSTRSRLLPDTETEQESAEDVPAPPNPLSNRAEIDAYLRSQNDIYLAKVKRHLENISKPAASLNTILPTLARRSALIRPPSTSASQTEKAAIPLYTVLRWRRSAAPEAVPRTTAAVLEQISRVVQNIEDLQQEPYRADVTPSAREKVNKKVADWTQEQKELELWNADLIKAGLEARFNSGVTKLENSVKQMLNEREQQRSEVDRSKGEHAGERSNVKEVPKVDGPTVAFKPSIANASAVSYQPAVGNDRSATPTPAPMAKTEGWGGSPTKILERKAYTGRTENPFANASPVSTPTSHADDSFGVLRSELASESESEAASTSRPSKDSLKAKQEEPKVMSLADLQRRMDASQNKKE